MSPADRLTDRKRAAIVAAAIAEFRARGFESTSMDRIATEAGVSKRTVYNHFASKDELFSQILQQLWDSSKALLAVPYRADQPLTAWVYAIARYKLADHFRGFARREALQDPLEDSEQTLLAVEDGEPAEARRDLGRLLGQLPDRQRLPIVHVKLDGLSVEETARLTGQSSSAVKVNIHRGLKALAALIRGTQNDEDR